jgi:hypothetical protein
VDDPVAVGRWAERPAEGVSKLRHHDCGDPARGEVAACG